MSQLSAILLFFPIFWLSLLFPLCYFFFPCPPNSFVYPVPPPPSFFPPGFPTELQESLLDAPIQVLNVLPSPFLRCTPRYLCPVFPTENLCCSLHFFRRLLLALPHFPFPPPLFHPATRCLKPPKDPPWREEPLLIRPFLLVPLIVPARLVALV